MFRLLARREQSEWVGYFLRSRASWTVYLDMSYGYRPEFVEHLMQVKGDVIKELSQMVIEEENKEDDDDESVASRGQGRFGRGQQSHRNKVVDSDDDAGSNDRVDSQEPASERSDVVR